MASTVYQVSTGLRTASQASAKRWPIAFSVYAAMHGLWLALYAFLGKGFAYAGYSPFYAGEFLLLAACIIILPLGRLASLALSSLGVVFLLFLCWQLLQAVPYIDVYGVNTLRDSVIWAYSLFAWVVAALVLRLPGFLRITVERFAQFGRWFLILGPLAWLATTYLQPSLPRWPGTSVTIPLLKGDEYAVHLVGIFALVLQGLGSARSSWVPLILADAVMAMNVRSGLLAFIVASCCAVALRPRPTKVLMIVCAAAMIVTSMAAFDLRVTVPGATREFSFQQLSDSVQSMVGISSRTDLEATKRWRLAWWSEIVEYTVNGPYFWNGKGYGVNLADSDGFQVGTRTEPLRSPHNSHLTILARTGVPGFSLWLALQLTWAFMLFRSYLRARSLKSGVWLGVFAWLLSYWLAFMVAAGFDVFLEGPMAGIPFWSLFGLGWGAHLLFQQQITRSTPDYSLRWSH